jgi:hypothetical protein
VRARDVTDRGNVIYVKAVPQSSQENSHYDADRKAFAPREFRDGCGIYCFLLSTGSDWLRLEW